MDQAVGWKGAFICHSVDVSLKISPEAAKLQTNKGSGIRGEIVATVSLRKYVSSILCLYINCAYAGRDE
jgi:hypothetical protein